MTVELVPLPLDGIAVPHVIKVPETIESLATGLAIVGGVLAAGGWATAAAVYAWTEPDGGGPRTGLKVGQLSMREFAELDLRGLQSRDTVRKYRRRWEEGVESGICEPAEIGKAVTLPAIDFTLPRGSADPDGDEWFTPRWLFDGLGIRFSIDVCAPDDLTYVSTPADHFYSANGLTLEWYGTDWCNPPYSDPEPWALRMVKHGDGLLLSHVPINGGWAVDVWEACDGLRLFQAMEFVRPDGSTQRPGYWLMLAAFGDVATDALAQLEVPPEVAENPRRVPSPMWTRA